MSGADMGLLAGGCAVLAALALGLLLAHALAIHFGALIAGMRGSLGRPLLVILVTALFMVPCALVIKALQGQVSETVNSVVSTSLLFAAECFAIKWLYAAPWGRALLAYLCAATFSAAALSVVMIALF